MSRIPMRDMRLELTPEQKSIVKVCIKKAIEAAKNGEKGVMFFQPSSDGIYLNGGFVPTVYAKGIRSILRRFKKESQCQKP